MTHATASSDGNDDFPQHYILATRYFFLDRTNYVRNENWQKQHLHTSRRNRIKDVITIYKEMIESAEKLPNNFTQFCKILKEKYDIKNPCLTEVGHNSFKADLTILGIEEEQYKEDYKIHSQYINENHSFQSILNSPDLEQILNNTFRNDDIIDISSESETEEDEIMTSKENANTPLSCGEDASSHTTDWLKTILN